MSDDAAIEETIRAFLEATAEGRGERIALVMPVSLTGAEPAPVDRVPVELGVRRWVNVWSLSAFLPVLAVVLLGLYGSWTVAGVLAFGFAAALVWTTRRAVRLTGSRPPELVGPPLAAAAALVAFGAYALVHG